MTQLRLFATLLFLAGMLFAHAQLTDPREKFSITADVDGATNTDYYWKNDNGDRIEEGRLKHGVAARVRASLKVFGNQQFALSVSPFYRYSNKELNINGTDGALQFDVPRNHHHYGGSLIANFNTRWLGKPFTLLAMGTANFSQYGYECTSGMIGGIFSITRNQKTYLGLGAICLIGTSVATLSDVYLYPPVRQPLEHQLHGGQQLPKLSGFSRLAPLSRYGDGERQNLSPSQGCRPSRESRD